MKHAVGDTVYALIPYFVDASSWGIGVIAKVEPPCLYRVHFKDFKSFGHGWNRQDYEIRTPEEHAKLCLTT